MTTKKIDIKNNKPPIGYNPIEVIRGALYHEICVPFNATPVWCMLKCLSFLELKSCGDISCLYTQKEKNEPSILDLIKFKNAQEAICKLAFVRPSFDTIISEILKVDFRISEKRKVLEKIENDIKNNKALSNSEKKELQKKADQIEFQIGFLLPDDTMSFVTAWALGVEITDIKKLSRNIILNAALMAKHYGNNTTDHITGVFTDFQKEDIDSHGLVLYNEFIKDKKREMELKKNNYKWEGK